MVNNLTMPWPGVAHYRPFLAWTQTPHPCLLPCATDTACLSASNIGEFSSLCVAKGRPFATGLYEAYLRSATLARKATAPLDGCATAVLPKSTIRAFACGSISG